ncbi:MAG: efflux RND transporter periplasmic adaptor subunit [Sphingomonadaceae bacterium]|nr:efflux RND transporter periplasmic adaptor subunit [Sphingomonadaceae bacterium]
MTEDTNRTKLIAGVAIAALVLGGGGVMLGRTVFAPTAATAPAEEGEHGEEETHGPEGFIAMDAARAQAAGIVTEAVSSGGLASEIIAQGFVATTSEGEAILTARADGAIVHITQHLGDNVRQGETIALLESREAATLTADRSAAAARVAAARSAYNREKRLFDARVTARQDLEAAQATLAEAEAELRRAQSAAGASKLAGDGRTMAIVSPIAGRLTKADARLGAYVLAGTDLFHVADPNRLQVNASVLPTDARRVSVGDTAVIELADGETRTATVHSITPALDAQSKTATLVLLPQGAAQLTAGQGVRVRVRPGGQPSDGRMTLPEESVQTVEGKNMVFVRGPKGFQATEVVIGERSGGRIEIISGISAGAVVATKGAFLLKAELGKGEAEH